MLALVFVQFDDGTVHLDKRKANPRTRIHGPADNAIGLLDVAIQIVHRVSNVPATRDERKPA